MRMMVPDFDWFDLEPDVLAMGTCRALRLKRIGRTFLIESGAIRRWMDGRFEKEEVVWKTVAISKGEDNRKSYVDAVQWLGDANVEVFKRIKEDKHHERQPG